MYRLAKVKSAVRRICPERIFPVVLVLWRVLPPRQLLAVVRFLGDRRSQLSLQRRVQLLRGLLRVTASVPCAHSEAEALAVIRAILSLPADVPGYVVEAGVYKGASAAKLSLASACVGRELLLFDSFQGIPSHSEEHSENIWGGQVEFPAGSYTGSLKEVEEALCAVRRSQCLPFRFWMV